MWSSGAIFVKLGLQSASVWSFLVLRAVAALALLTGIVAVAQRDVLRDAFSLPLSKTLQALSIGLVLQVAYQSSFFLAIAHGLSPGVLAIVLGMQPLITPWMAREALGWKAQLTLAVGFAGLVVAVYGSRDTSAVTAAGVTYATLAVVAITAGTVLQKRTGISPAVSALWQYVAASIVFGSVVLWTGWQVTFDARFIISLAWMAGVVSVGAILLLLHMLANDSVTRVNVLFYLVPVLTMALDFAIFGTPVTLLTIAGGLAVVAAIRLFRTPNRAARSEDPFPDLAARATPRE
jgi:drug/metabolite transporter (DMT)-like permease